LASTCLILLSETVQSTGRQVGSLECGHSHTNKANKAGSRVCLLAVYIWNAPAGSQPLYGEGAAAMDNGVGVGLRRCYIELAGWPGRAVSWADVLLAFYSKCIPGWLGSTPACCLLIGAAL